MTLSPQQQSYQRSWEKRRSSGKLLQTATFALASSMLAAWGVGLLLGSSFSRGVEQGRSDRAFLTGLRSRRRLQRSSLRSGNRAEGQRAKVVFLGSPACVEVVLRTLWEAAESSPDFELCAVVSQPPKRVKKKITKTPIQEMAEDLGVPCILTPDKAKDEAFLTELEALKPDVCITAAYGQYLPRRFLEAPSLGTINLHPSLLPRWRGASPVQRCLEAGDEETGITILYTVAKMDAGPIILQRSLTLDGSETQPDLLDGLFKWGAELLVEEALPKVLRGEMTMESAQQQDESLVVQAPLIAKEEAKLWPHNETALQMRDKVRGFTGWPGTTLPVACSGTPDAEREGVRVKVANAEVVPASSLDAFLKADMPTEELFLVEAAGRTGEPAVGLRPAMDPESVLLLRAFHMPGKAKEVNAVTFSRGYMTFQTARWMTPEEELRLVEAAKNTPKKPKTRKRR